LECRLGSRCGPRLGPRLERRLGWSPLECRLGSRLECGLGLASSRIICRRLGSPLGLGSSLECRLGRWCLLGLAVLTLSQDGRGRLPSNELSS
jgi:hypothetical protein